jgi:predicted DNA-binding ribbon-helix-helix protein
VGEEAVSPVLKRSIVIEGHKTSVSLEDEFWNSFKEIAEERGMTLAAMIGAIDGGRKHANLSSAIRLFVLDVYRDQLASWGRHWAMSKVSDPQHWRRRAEEARTLADELTDPEAKRKMLKIAEDYKTLSIRSVQRLRHHSSATIRNWRR